MPSLQNTSSKAALNLQSRSWIRNRVPRCGRQAGRQQEPPDGALRDAHAELEQLTGDSRIAPARILPRQAQNKLPNATLNWRPAAALLSLRPFAAYELSVPAKQRLRRHDQPVPTSRRQHPAERREKDAIGCPKRRPWLLPPEHRKLMAKNERFDILGELAAAATHEQPQQRREREIRERKEHPSVLPDLAPDYIENRNLGLEPLKLSRR
jgi:hypothetical protein